MHVNHPHSVAVAYTGRSALDQVSRAARGRADNPHKTDGAPRIGVGGPDGSPNPNAGKTPAPAVNASEAAEIAATAQPPETGATSEPKDPVRALLDAWGTDNKEFDLNTDGTVDIFDLYELLNQLSRTPSGAHPVDTAADETPAAAPAGEGVAGTAVTDPEAASAGHTDATDPDGDGEGEGPELTVRGLLDAWGESGGRYDLNTDGTVDIFDLYDLLSRLSSGQDPNLRESAAGQAGSAKPLTPGGVNASHAQADGIASRILDGLYERGFKSRPPANLNDIIDQLKVDDDQRQAVRSRVLGSYPKGLDLNVVG